jgi:hypothetical protein
MPKKVKPVLEDTPIGPITIDTHLVACGSCKRTAVKSGRGRIL